MPELLQQGFALWVVTSAIVYPLYLIAASDGGKWWEYVFGPAILAAVLVAFFAAIAGFLQLLGWALQVLGA